MDAIAEHFIAFIRDENNPIGLAVMAAAAAIEYVFPPFPGDTVTLFGAVLITVEGWNFWGVFAAVMIGSAFGSMLAFYFGSGWRKRRFRAPARRASLDRLVDKFHRHGPVYLVLNRFLPGVRSVFFVAAGLAEMPARAVLLYSLVSAAVWNLGLIALGGLLGANFDTLLGWVRQYTMVVWAGLAGLALLWLGRLLWRRL
ncbi:MAG: hypothetical protein Tsb0020_25590 [Haliangiales bacterium]